MGACQNKLGACQDKQIIIVCSCDLDGNHAVLSHYKKDELTFQVSRATATPTAASSASVSSAGPGLVQPPAPSPLSSAVSPEKLPPEKLPHQQQEKLPEEPSSLGPEAVQPALTPEKPNLLLELTESLHLTGNFARWSTSFPQTQLQPVPSGAANVARLKLCVKMTSMSFSFQVVSSKREWSWRLYPRDAQPLRWAHVSKEGRLKPDDPDAVVVGLGNLENGHGLNFHVVEEEPQTVTIWVEVPVSSTEDGLVLQAGTAEGARVWFTREDTGVQFTGGDGVDLNRYKWMRPADW